MGTSCKLAPAVRGTSYKLAPAVRGTSYKLALAVKFRLLMMIGLITENCKSTVKLFHKK